MKIRIKPIAYTVLTCWACLLSCGENTSPLSSGPLGELPVIVYEAETRIDGLHSKLTNTTDRAETTAIIIESERISNEKNAAIEKIAGTLKETSLNSEVAVNVPLKLLQDFKIKEIYAKNNKVALTAETELTAPGTYLNNGSLFQLSDIRVVVYDADGIPFCANKNGGFCLDKTLKFADSYPQGTKGSVSITFAISSWNAQQMGKLGKIVVSTKDREDYLQAIKTESDARNIYENEIKKNEK